MERRFDRAANSFDGADFAHAVTRKGLFDRIQPMLIDAAIVVDLGCGTGAAIRPLAKRFRSARIVGVDRSQAMLDRCRKHRRWFAKVSFVKADARKLPFPDNSIDVVFSNLMLPWIDDISALAREVSRVLRKDGLFAFSTLGPDSLGILRQAWAAVDRHAHVNAFIDMHDVGDSLRHNGLRDPVLDVDRLAVTYNNADALFRDLTALGARNALVGRAPTVTSPAALNSVRQAMDTGGVDGKISVDLEIVYGHCWGGGRHSTDGAVRIDPGGIPVRRR